MFKKLSLSKKTKDLIDLFFQLPIARKKIRCPYFKHQKKLIQKRFKSRVLIGKGHPQEIVTATEALLKKPEKKSAKEIRDLMKKRGLGIDCSGFVSWVLDSWYQEKKKGKHFWRKIGPSLLSLKGIRFFFRPVENLNVKTILRSKKCQAIKKVAQIKPGDLIHFGERHLLLVQEVVRDSKKRTVVVSYCHSADYYDGVHQGLIKINDFNQGLEKQKWIEKGQKRNWSHDEYLSTAKSGVVRLKFF